MTTLALFLILFIQGPKAAEKPADPPKSPDRIEIKGEDYERLKRAELEARVATLEAENLEMRIRAEIERLNGLKQTAQTKATAYETRVTFAAKLNRAQLPEYSIADENGQLVLTKKLK